MLRATIGHLFFPFSFERQRLIGEIYLPRPDFVRKIEQAVEKLQLQREVCLLMAIA
jgi:hypothetical protein